MLIFDGALEQVGANSTFMHAIRKNNINWQTTEPYSPWQNRAEDAIREIKRRMKRRRVRDDIPKRLWDFQLNYECDIMNLTATGPDRRTNYERVTGDTPDISEYVDFGFYDPVWFWDHPTNTENPHIGRWLGVSHRVGSIMCYYVIKANGHIESRTTLQRVTDEELLKPEFQQKITDFDSKLRDRLNDENFQTPTLPGNEFYIDDVDNTDDELQMVNNDGENQLPDTDDIDYSPDAFDQYLNAEIQMPQQDGNLIKARVTKRMKDDEGRPIGKSNANPLLDTRLYKVEYPDGRIDELQANTIAENMYAQCDTEGRQYLLLNEISDHRKDETALTKENGYVIGRGGNRHCKRTTKGWKLLVEWKDKSTQWVPLKDLKQSNPVQLAEYAVTNKIADEPAFAWWVGYTLRKRNRIISKIKARYWKTTHKFGIELPHSVEEAYEIDERNGNRNWTDAIEKEMKKIYIFQTFELWDKGTPDDLRSGKVKMPGFKELTVHMVFDIKMDGKFTRKARLVADGHKTETPSAMTYASVVSRDSVRIAFLLAALNGLEVLGCDVANAFINAPCKEKYWLEAGPEFGNDQGCVMIYRKALYGLKSSGASWKEMLQKVLTDMKYEPTYADPDVWRRPAVTPDGFEYYELVLAYVDDLLCISHNPKATMDDLSKTFDLKDTVKTPDRYLGANIGQYTLPDGRTAWSMSGKDYVKNSVKIVKEILGQDGKSLSTGKKAERPFNVTYKPELDTSPVLNAKLQNRFQQLMGILRWAVELGRIDINLEVSLLSTYLCEAREGHLEAAYNIFAYLSKHIESNLVFDDKVPELDERNFTNADWSQSIYSDEPEELPPNMPTPRGNPVTITCFVDANHAGNMVTRRSHTGVIIFLNNAPILWFSKKQNTVESSTFGSEFVAARIATDMIESLRYKLRMFGVPIDGPANVFCDNQSVVKNSSLPESTLNKKHNAICYHRVREAAARGMIRMGKEQTQTNIADLLTKVLDTRRRRLLLECIFIKGG